MYELADVSVVSARVYDMDAWASPTALAFDQAVAVQGPQDSDLENSIWQAGSGRTASPRAIWPVIGSITTNAWPS